MKGGGENIERFTNLRVILAQGAMLIFSVSFQFLQMHRHSKYIDSLRVGLVCDTVRAHMWRSGVTFRCRMHAWWAFAL